MRCTARCSFIDLLGVSGANPDHASVREKLWALGFDPKVFKKASKSDKTKALDIALCTDILSHAFLDNYDVALLIAGDQDYVPLVDELPTRKERKMRNPRIRFLLIASGMLAAAAISASPVSAASDEAGCVGQFSSFFAQQGQRDDVAQNFAHNTRPAGQNVYSHVAEFHGTLQQCFDQT